MKTIIVSDFDGTITKKDSLYDFFETYADNSWLEVEDLWVKNKIGSMECLVREFELVRGLDEKLIDEYTSKIELDSYFKDFINKNNYDFLIVSDGIDYFINKILEKNNIKNIKIISNHAEFIDNKFVLSFPNKNSKCVNQSGTCKCSVVKDLKQNYDKIIYIGDGQSDFCVADKADILYAKGSLLKYCQNNKINCREFQSFKDISTSRPEYIFQHDF